MAAIYRVDATQETPAVLLDKDKEILVLAGRSLPENVNDFYEPVLQWFREYMQSPLPKTVVNLKLEYFSTATSKLLYDLMLQLEELQHKKYKVVIKWHYPEGDEDIYQAGKEYAEMLDIPFQFQEYNEDEFYQALLDTDKLVSTTVSG